MSFPTVPAPASQVKRLTPKNRSFTGTSPVGFESHPKTAEHMGPQFAGGGPINAPKTQFQNGKERMAYGMAKADAMRGPGKHAKPSSGLGTPSMQSASKPPSESATGPRRATFSSSVQQSSAASKPVFDTKTGGGKHRAGTVSGTNPYNQSVPKPGKHRETPHVGSEDTGRHASGYSPGKDIAKSVGAGASDYHGKHRAGGKKPSQAKSKISGALNKVHSTVRKIKSPHAGKLAGHLNASSGK
jgi:hypothetical protein